MGLIGAVTGLGQSLINRGTEKRNIQLQGKQNMKLAEYQYGKDLDMWNRMNEYNTPEAQMGRFKEAGLNPNLMYGQGSSGNATTMPKYQAPEINVSRTPFNAMNVLGAYQDTTLKQAQIDNVKAQRRNTDADTVIKLSEGRYADAINEAKAGKTLQEWKNENIKRIWNEQELREVMYEKDGLFFIKPQYYPKYVEALNATRFEKPVKEVEQIEGQIKKTQADAAAVQILSDIRTKEKEFLESGGKYFQPIIQFIKMLTGR